MLETVRKGDRTLNRAEPTCFHRIQESCPLFGQSRLTKIPQRVPGEIEKHAAGKNAEDVDQLHPREGGAAEGDADDQVKYKQNEHDCGYTESAPAQPFFHRQPFHRLHTICPAAPGTPEKCGLGLLCLTPLAQQRLHCSGSLRHCNYRPAEKNTTANSKSRRRWHSRNKRQGAARKPSSGQARPLLSSLEGVESVDYARKFRQARQPNGGA